MLSICGGRKAVTARAAWSELNNVSIYSHQRHHKTAAEVKKWPGVKYWNQWMILKRKGCQIRTACRGSVEISLHSGALFDQTWEVSTGRVMLLLLLRRRRWWWSDLGQTDATGLREGRWLMAPAVPEERNTGRQLVTCSPRHDCDRSVWHCVSLQRPEFRPLFITAGKTSRGATGGKRHPRIKKSTWGNRFSFGKREKG